MLDGRAILTLFIVFLSGCVAPHFLQAVKLPAFGVHHVYDHIDIVDEYPLGRMRSFMMKGFLGTFLQYLILNVIRDGPDLRLTACFADDKKISHCFIDFPEVEGHNVFPFLFLDRCNNGFDDF